MASIPGGSGAKRISTYQLARNPNKQLLLWNSQVGTKLLTFTRFCPWGDKLLCVYDTIDSLIIFTVYVVFADSHNQLNSLIFEFWFISCRYTPQYTMKENRRWFVTPKLKDIFSHIISSLWKRNNSIWFLTKDDVRMELDGNGCDRDNTTIWNSAQYISSTLIKVMFFILWHPISLYWGGGQWVKRTLYRFTPVLGYFARRFS